MCPERSKGLRVDTDDRTPEPAEETPLARERLFNQLPSEPWRIHAAPREPKPLFVSFLKPFVVSHGLLGAWAIRDHIRSHGAGFEGPLDPFTGQGVDQPRGVADEE